jgi:ribosomal-protein-alanine N-acetyltransferase
MSATENSSPLEAELQVSVGYFLSCKKNGLNSMNIDEPLVIRAAHTSDAGYIASMSRLLVEHGLKWRWTTARVKSSIADRETMVLMASHAGSLSGFAIMKFRDEESHLFLLATATRFQRNGVGSALLTWLEKSCRTAGIRHVRVELRASNHPARAFYEHQGFRFVRQIPDYYDKREAAIVMVKSLQKNG